MARQQTAQSDPYEGLRTRARWKSADAARVVTEWTESGESMTAFARRRSLARHRLHYWHERLGAKRAAFATAGLGVRLVPVVVRPASAPLVSLGPPTTGVSVCVVANGVRVELSDPHGTDPQWVAALVHGLSKGCA